MRCRLVRCRLVPPRQAHPLSARRRPALEFRRLVILCRHLPLLLHLLRRPLRLAILPRLARRRADGLPAF